MLYSKEEILDVFKKCQSRADVCRVLKIPINGSGMRKVNKWIIEHSIDISHFISGSEKCRKYPLIEKECPVCKKIFRTSHGAPKEKSTCSIGCSNTLFRSGTNNGNWKHGRSFIVNGHYVTDPQYRTVCFQYYDKKCAICGWDKSIDVHHIDGNNKNNSPKNLIPLCANHHRLTVITQYKDEIQKEIDEIVNKKFT